MKVKTPKEDPRIKSAREAEERRADAAFIESTSESLDEETRRRIRKLGARARVSAARGGVVGGSGSVGGGPGGGTGAVSGGYTGVSGGGGFGGSRGVNSATQEQI